MFPPPLGLAAKHSPQQQLDFPAEKLFFYLLPFKKCVFEQNAGELIFKKVSFFKKTTRRRQRRQRMESFYRLPRDLLSITT